MTSPFPDAHGMSSFEPTFYEQDWGRAVPTHQGCGFSPQWGTYKIINECINKWNNKLMFLSHSLSISVSFNLPIFKINQFNGLIKTLNIKKNKTKGKETFKTAEELDLFSAKSGSGMSCRDIYCSCLDKWEAEKGGKNETPGKILLHLFIHYLIIHSFI